MTFSERNIETAYVTLFETNIHVLPQMLQFMHSEILCCSTVKFNQMVQSFCWKCKTSIIFCNFTSLPSITYHYNDQVSKFSLKWSYISCIPQKVSHEKTT